VVYTQLSACYYGRAAASGRDPDTQNELAGTKLGLNAYCQKSPLDGLKTKIAL
jgi:hypothetical protein